MKSGDGYWTWRLCVTWCYITKADYSQREKIEKENGREKVFHVHFKWIKVDAFSIELNHVERWIDGRQLPIPVSVFGGTFLYVSRHKFNFTFRSFSESFSSRVRIISFHILSQRHALLFLDTFIKTRDDSSDENTMWMFYSWWVELLLCFSFILVRWWISMKANLELGGARECIIFRFTSSITRSLSLHYTFLLTYSNLF